MNSHYSQLQLSARALVWGTIGACCAGLVACSGSETLEPESDTPAPSDLTAFEETQGDSNVSASEFAADGETGDPSLQEDDSSLGTDEPEIGALEQALTGAMAGTIEMGWQLWGYTVVTPVGGACPQGTTRDHIEITSDYGSPATSEWYFPHDETKTDCSAKITTSVQNGHFDTFHWRILTSPVNLAAKKPATQSSTLYGAGAERAVDGKSDGDWNVNSVTHTGWDAQAWWQVDFGVVKSIGKVVLYNRTDCCSDRLSNFDILVSNGYDPNTGYNWTVAGSLGGQLPPTLTFPMSTSGRLVRVQLRGTNYLSLAEVQVFAP